MEIQSGEYKADPETRCIRIRYLEQLTFIVYCRINIAVSLSLSLSLFLFDRELILAPALIPFFHYIGTPGVKYMAHKSFMMHKNRLMARNR